MISPKYYDYKLCRHIDIDHDGCPMDNWATEYGKALFAKHPGGFLVFLPPHELLQSDEYKKSDPYTVEENFTSDFHQRRIECTLDLIGKALGSSRQPLKILDLGCGKGLITSKILQEFPDIEISGLDYSVSAIVYAVDHFPGIDFVVANVYECPYVENYFDVVVCNNLWEHVPDPLVLLSKIHKILRPQGFLIISTPSRYRLENLIRVLRGKPIVFMSKQHIMEYSVGQVLEQLRHGGFRTIQSYSKPIKSRRVKTKMAKAIISLFVSIIESHHQLESTVFYLAQRLD